MGMDMDGQGPRFSIRPASLTAFGYCAKAKKREFFVGHRVLKCVEM